MSVLSDGRLIEMIADGKLKLVPFILDNIQPASIDLRLDPLIKIPQADKVIKVTEDSKDFFEEYSIKESYLLKSGQWVLGQTMEEIGIPGECNANVHNRSSFARLGVDVSLVSYINPGYIGHLPIVIRNIGTFDVEMIPGVRICQMELSDIEPAPLRDYSQRKDAKYFGEINSLVSKIHLDRELQAFNADKPSGATLAQFLKEEIEKSSRDIMASIPEALKKELGLL